MIHVDWQEAQQRAQFGRRRHVAAVTTAALEQAKITGRDKAILDRMFEGIQAQFAETATVYWTQIPDDQGTHFTVLAWEP